MHPLTFFTVLSAVVLAVSAATNPVVIKGKYFFDSVTKDRFYVKGVDYQPSADPIADVAGLQRDIPYMKQLGINTIRCYQTDFTLSHETGMQLLADAGIYVLIDLSDPFYSIQSLSPSWNTILFNFFRLKAGAFAKYDNTLGYIAANEVVLPDGSTPAAAYVKAAIRDVKAWLKSQGHKKPVGYAAADVPENVDMQNFLDCNSVDETADFYGVNIYRWCGNSDVTKSGYAALANQWKDYDIPWIFSEYGCNTAGTRPFTEIQSIYGPDMDPVLSGGLVYEWHQEVNNYGLVTINSDNTVTLLPDFQNLKNQLAKAKPTPLNMDKYAPNPAALSPCPQQSDTWKPASSPLPNVPNAPKCTCMWNQLTCRITSDDFDYTATPKAVRTATGQAYQKVCGESAAYCQKITSNPTTGLYGDWTDCNDFERVSFAMDQRYKALGGGAANCQFDGLSTEVVAQPKTPAGTDCKTTANAFPYAPPPTRSGTGTGVGDGGSGNNQYCGTGLYPCGTGCYDPTAYCCQNHQLLPKAQCDPNQSTESYSAGVATSPATKASTGNAESTKGNNGAASGNTGAAASGNTGASDVPAATGARPQNSSAGTLVLAGSVLVACVLSLL